MQLKKTKLGCKLINTHKHSETIFICSETQDRETWFIAIQQAIQKIKL